MKNSNNFQVQMAPSIQHQAEAILSILRRYEWHQFAVITTQIAGKSNFIQAIRELIITMEDTFK